MNFLVFLPFILLVVPFIPAFVEFFRRKDKGPREIPEQTTYEEKPGIEGPREVPRLERARGEARAKEPGEVMRVMGDVTIPDRTEIDNHLVVQGSLTLGKNCHIRGSIKAFGDVEIGEYSVVDGHVLSEGKILVSRESVVRGVVDSLQDIVLEENATVEAVSTEKTVRLGPGARIRKRVVSGVSIDTSPAEQPELSPSTVKPVVKPVEPVRRVEEKPAVSQPAVPHAEMPRPEKPLGKPMEITDRIFSSLEDRIRKFDEHRRESAEEIKLEGLTPTAARVFQLACVCHSLEEISLRLLMDPVEVQEVLKVLIEKGYLDKDLKPKKPEAKGDLQTGTVKEAKVSPEHQPFPAGLEVEKEPKVLVEKAKGKQPSEDEILESLLAAKMRDELKKKVRSTVTESSKGELKSAGGEDAKTSDAGHGGIEEIMKEWGRASSSLWKNQRKDRDESSGNSHPADSVGQTEAAAEKGEK